MLKRVFTEILRYSAVIDDTDWVYTLAANLWQPQEDIMLIGWDVSIELCSFQTAEGIITAYAELSQSGDWNKPGSLGRAHVHEEYWEVVAACVGRIYVPSWTHVMLPEGHGIPVREGGNIYLHAQHITSAGAHTAILGARALLFYVKGK